MKSILKPIAFAILLFLCVAISTAVFPKEPERYRIICIPKIIDESDFWRVLIEGVEMAAQEYNVDLELMAANNEKDYLEQNRIIEEAVRKQPNAILLAAADYEKTYEAAKLLKGAGIKLIIIDSGIKQDIVDVTVATDNIKAGIRVGAVAKKIVGETGRIGVISFVKNSKSALDREEGLRVGLSDDKDKIINTFYCDSDYDKAYHGTIHMLTNNPDINVVVGLNQYSAVGAARAIKDLKLDSKVKMVGIDSSIEQVQYLEEGIFEAIVVQNPFNIGYLGMENAVKLLKGEYVPKNLDSGSALVTKDNMFLGMNQKLVFPFNED